MVATICTDHMSPYLLVVKMLSNDKRFSQLVQIAVRGKTESYGNIYAAKAEFLPWKFLVVNIGVTQRLFVLAEI